MILAVHTCQLRVCAALLALQTWALIPASANGMENDLRSKLDLVAQRAEMLDSLYLSTECRVGDGYHNVEIWGRGVGIWDSRRQFDLDHQDLLALVSLLREARFVDLSERYGGRPEQERVPPVEPAESAGGLRMICRVAAELDGSWHESIQLDTGEQSPDLQTLARDILARCETLAVNGLEVADLDAGLTALADGRLAPEALHLRLHHKTESEEATKNSGEIRLQLVGRRTSLETTTRGTVVTRTVELDDVEFSRLMASIAAAVPGRLPANLWAEDYTDLSVRVLNHRITIQARQFAGMDSRTHGEWQRAFDALFLELTALAEQVVAAPTP